MTSAAERKRAEFENLAIPHVRSLYGVAVRLARTTQDAEDLVQETLLRGYRFFDRYEPDTNIRAWLFKIMRNLFINRYHQVQREPDCVDFEAIEENLERLLASQAPAGTGAANPEQIFLAGALGEEVERALRELPEEYRLVLLLTAIEDLSFKEVAAVLSCPIGTVMSRLHRARRLMQEKLTGSSRGHDVAADVSSEAKEIPMSKARLVGLK